MDVLCIPLGLLDGHNKYQEFGCPTDCGDKIWRDIFLSTKNETYFGDISLTDRNLIFQQFLGNIRLVEEKKPLATVSLTQFFLLMILDIAKPTKSQTQVRMVHVPTTKSTHSIWTDKKHRSLDVFWIFWGYLLDF